MKMHTICRQLPVLIDLYIQTLTMNKNVVLWWVKDCLIYRYQTEVTEFEVPLLGSYYIHIAAL